MFLTTLIHTEKYRFNYGRKWDKALMQQTNIKLPVKSNNTPALINALANHAGVGVMPLSFALQGFVCLDNISCDVPVHYYLYANRHSKDIPRVRTVINFYKDIMDKLKNPVPVPALSEDPLPIIRRMGNL